jgi:GNAT superfamily N-acetyltransferase
MIHEKAGTDAWHLREDYWAWDPDPDIALVYEYGPPTAYRACVRLFQNCILSSGGVHLDALGIGGVFTQEGWRGRGFATALLHYVELAYKPLVLVLYSRGGDLYLYNGYEQITDELMVKIFDDRIHTDLNVWTLNRSKF